MRRLEPRRPPESFVDLFCRDGFPRSAQFLSSINTRSKLSPHCRRGVLVLVREHRTVRGDVGGRALGEEVGDVGNIGIGARGLFGTDWRRGPAVCLACQRRLWRARLGWAGSLAGGWAGRTRGLADALRAFPSRNAAFCGSWRPSRPFRHHYYKTKRFFLEVRV